MKSLIKNNEVFLKNKQNLPDNKNTQKFQKIFKERQKQSNSTEHKELLQYINLKNNALTKHLKQKKQIQNHPNYLTFCQKYASILCQKYDISKLPNQNQKQKKLAYQQKQYNQQFNKQANRTKMFVFLKRFFEHTQFEFQRQQEQILLKLKNMVNHIEIKNKYFKEKDQCIQHQIRQLNIQIKIVNKKSKNQLQITPFQLVLQNQHQISNNNVHKLKPVSEIRQDKTPLRKTVQIKKMFISNALSPQSPDLLSGCRQTDQNNLLISFKKNLQTSQNIYSTFKYSDSQSNLNYDKQANHLSSQISAQEEQNYNYKLQSPVQPYRLNKIKTQQNQYDTVKQDEINNKKNGSDIILQLAKHFQSNTKHKTSNSLKSIKIVYQRLSQQTYGLNSAIKNIIFEIDKEKNQLDEQWGESLQYIGKQIQDLQSILNLEKTEYDLKDKRFLQNLQCLQNQLIQQIFGQKQQRKDQQNLLTQMLSNLVQTLQNNSQ